MGFHYRTTVGLEHKRRCLTAQKREGYALSGLRDEPKCDSADVTDPVCSFKQSWGRQPLADQLCSELTSPPFSSLSAKADRSDRIDTAAAALQTTTMRRTAHRRPQQQLNWHRGSLYKRLTAISSVLTQSFKRNAVKNSVIIPGRTHWHTWMPFCLRVLTQWAMWRITRMFKTGNLGAEC